MDECTKKSRFDEKAEEDDGSPTLLEEVEDARFAYTEAVQEFIQCTEEYAEAARSFLVDNTLTGYEFRAVEKRLHTQRARVEHAFSIAYEGIFKLKSSFNKEDPDHVHQIAVVLRHPSEDSLASLLKHL